MTDRSLFLRNDLPSKWCELYTFAVRRPTNIIRFQHHTFEYLYDQYSGIEAMGEVPYDQTVEDRVVAVFGTSADPEQSHAGRHIRPWLGEQSELLGGNRDKGHFIARCIGGEFNLNVFSQDRHLNRGCRLKERPIEKWKDIANVTPAPSAFLVLFTLINQVFRDGSSSEYPRTTRIFGLSC